MSKSTQEPPRFAWAIVALIVLVLLIVGVLDYFDGAASSPSPYLFVTLATVAGLVLGRKIPPGPWSGGGK